MYIKYHHHEPGTGVDEVFRRRRDFLVSVFNFIFIAFAYSLYFVVVVGQRDVTISKKRSRGSLTDSEVSIAVSRLTTSPFVKNDRHHLPNFSTICTCINANSYQRKSIIIYEHGHIPFEIASLISLRSAGCNGAVVDVSFLHCVVKHSN